MSFSREYIFLESLIRGKHLVIDFKHGSKAFYNYGASASFSAIYTDDELEEMITNFRDKNDTSGIVRGEILAGNPTVEQKELMKKEGFHTDDIVEILPQRGFLNRVV